MDRNRHGIPTYRPPAQRKPPRLRGCPLAGCDRPSWKAAELEVCEHHAEVIAYRVGMHAEVRLGQTRERWLKPTEPRPERPAPPAQPETGWIYYVLVDGHYKIGYTQDVKARIKGYPPTAKLLAQHRGTKADETALHRKFALHCVAGREWYRVNDEITQYIDSVITIHGRCVDAFEVNRRAKTPPIAGIRPRTTRKKRYTPD